MKMKKLLALALLGVMSISMLTACGGDDGEDNTEIVQENDDEAGQVAEDDNVAEIVSDETWELYIKTQFTMGKLMEAMDQDTPEDVADAADEMIAFSEEHGPKQRDEYTEEYALEAIDIMNSYIELMAPYVDIAEDGTITRK